MANRYLYPGVKSAEIGLEDLFARVTFGAAGAPTLDSTVSKGIASITRVSAGKYDIVLSDTYQKLMAASSMFVGSAAPAAPNVRVFADSSNDPSTPKLTMQFYVDAGTATDPASGEEVRMRFIMKNSIQ